MSALRDHTPLLFPKSSSRIAQGLPSKVVQQWKDMTYFFFLSNGLTSKNDIRRFLKAQTMGRLDDIAFAFDIIGDDLISEKERKEGVKLQEKHRDMIIDEILNSLTR